MTPNFGAPGARCGKAATRSPPKALQTPTPTVEYSHSPLYLLNIYMLIMLADNILYAAAIAVPLALLCRVTLPSSSAPVAAITTEFTTIHPGFLRPVF